MLREAGLEPHELRTVLHVPRVLAVLACRALERRSTPAFQRRFLRWLMKFEALERWPTRFLSGYYLAVRATRT
jgi:hypothetical protein